MEIMKGYIFVTWVTYKSTKFFKFPNESGIFPVKLFADRSLQG